MPYIPKECRKFSLKIQRVRGHFILDETDKRRYAIYIGFEEIGAMQIMYSKEVQVTNQVGLYARPATFFIQKANEFKSTILVEKEERRVNAKSLLGILSLGITKGTTINRMRKRLFPHWLSLSHPILLTKLSRPEGKAPVVLIGAFIFANDD